VKRIISNRVWKNFILLSCIMFVFGCGDQLAIYTNRAFDLKFRYPPDWEKKDYYGETLVTFLTPKSGKADIFLENINIAVQDVGYVTTLDAYTEGVADTVKRIGQVGDIHQRMIRDGYRMIGGRRGYEVVYTLTKYGTPQELLDAGIAEDKIDTIGQTFQLFQVWTIYDGRAYIFTYLAAENEYDKYFESVEALIKSVQFI